MPSSIIMHVHLQHIFVSDGIYVNNKQIYNTIFNEQKYTQIGFVYLFTFIPTNWHWSVWFLMFSAKGFEGKEITGTKGRASHSAINIT